MSEGATRHREKPRDNSVNVVSKTHLRLFQLFSWAGKYTTSTLGESSSLSQSTVDVCIAAQRRTGPGIRFTATVTKYNGGVYSCTGRNRSGSETGLAPVVFCSTVTPAE